MRRAIRSGLKSPGPQNGHAAFFCGRDVHVGHRGQEALEGDTLFVVRWRAFSNMRWRTKHWAWLAASLALACAPKARTPAQAAAPQTSHPAQNQWVSTLDRDHPLTGRVLDVRRGGWVSPADVLRAAALSDRVFLGEQHDNADHHRLQAEVLGAVVAAGKQPTLVAEMLDAVDQEELDAARAASPSDPDAIAAAVRWEESGWPPWPLYRPVFAKAAAARLPVVGAGLDRTAARSLVKQGLSAFDAEVAQRFALATPPSPAEHERLRDEMRAVHCGFLPEAMLDGMVLVQRARDALLAERTLRSARGAVVLAGAGHVREDAGAPRALERASGQPSLTVAFVEVQHEKTRPEEYAAAFGAPSLPFDYVWFTPRASDVDHCDELRKHHPHAAPPKTPPPDAPSPSPAPPP